MSKLTHGFSAAPAESFASWSGSLLNSSELKGDDSKIQVGGQEELVSRGISKLSSGDKKD